MQLEKAVSFEAERTVKRLFPLAECRTVRTSHGVERAIFPDPSDKSLPIGGTHPCDDGAWIRAALWHEDSDEA